MVGLAAWKIKLYFTTLSRIPLLNKFNIQLFYLYKFSGAFESTQNCEVAVVATSEVTLELLSDFPRNDWADVVSEVACFFMKNISYIRFIIGV